MTEQAAKALVATLGGAATFPMPGSRTWGVTVERSDGHLAVIEDQAGWVYEDRAAYDDAHRDGDHEDHIVASTEWMDWDGSEEWARGLSAVLGSEEYWHSGGGIWLVFYNRLDGKFVVIGSESGGVYASREEFEADEYGEKAENHVFV
jgi:hypothetical protein